MPIFHYPERSTSPPARQPNSETGNHRNHSADSKWKKDQFKEIEMSESSPQNSSTYNYHFLTSHSKSREELIQSIKRGESPTWVHQYVEKNFSNQPARSNSSFQDWSLDFERNTDSTSDKDSVRPDASGVDERSELAKPSEIERPRSALHSGDFREGAAQNQETKFPDFDGYNSSPQPPSFKRYGSSPTTPWFNHVASARHIPRDTEVSPLAGQHVRSVLGARSRAPSLGSFSSSYILKAPTSPLVHQANNTDLDFSTKRESTDDLEKSIKHSRRRTLPSEAFVQLRGSPPNQSRTFNLSRSFASAHGSEDSRLQAYQPHRSSFYSLQPASSSPQTHFRLRRPSFASDSSPRIHASMVGSYEESILRGRMSTTPSQPLDFTAQIGVLGRGKCKSNLKCPPHITVPFPAVFYSYPTSGPGRSISDDSPSPYVGLIDLQNAQSRNGSSEKKRPRVQKTRVYDNSGSSTPIPSPDCGERQRREKRSSRSDSARAPPGGSYRIPQRGQLQIVIKNPNKTAVKLFLVPYDLDDMEPGTKTFIRQRSYSAGPIIDMPLTARKNLGTDRPEASLNPTSDPKDKPTLRYLIHLNICCPSKGRFYLHSTIRVVFANRVPDGKEKLRNEIQLPEPRYSPYKPVKESNNSAGDASAFDKSHRRRSTGVGLTSSQFFDDKFYPDSPSASSNHKQVQPVPFKLNIPNSRGPSTEDDGPSFFSNNDIWQSGNRSPSDEMSLGSPLPPKSPHICNDDAEMSNDDSKYYGNSHQLATSPTGYSSIGESLLAQRLREWSCNGEQSSDSQE
ncbi:hypothetical protein TMatcc_006048 [Talaromyces marneffei ATCC 18224]|uniref:Atos-like conserved domain-containing protein n=1 Tax=Talaromyces marneffei (strain ATCC 18224 / CBS 334.59 / QM 7333) TaxID=441960 RepID=B6QCR7_TALMQ|nr:uncharacterized protein EYB26_002974 [Talaromyces marneffei]EEA25721.1 conserved hypothetical protein [Talaromyces marneffei ATCC 18224]QGA15317.1 hypothetical protein EYB26_002974 [Talaromyces marneffei]